MLVFLYLFWLKRDIWLKRFLTSNARVRRSTTPKSEILLEQSLENSSPKEDSIDNIPEKDDINDFPRINQSNTSTERTPKKTRHSSSVVRRESELLFPKENSTIHFSTYHDILEQLRNNLRSRTHERKLFVQLSKATGLTRVQLNRFIHKKDFRLITFERFLIFLDLFDLMVLIVPK